MAKVVKKTLDKTSKETKPLLNPAPKTEQTPQMVEENQNSLSENNEVLAIESVPVTLEISTETPVKKGKVGKPRIIGSPDDLWALFIQYKQWVIDNPFYIQDYVGGQGRVVDREKARPLTSEGFSNYCVSVLELGWRSNIKQYLYPVKENGHAEYLPVAEKILGEIRQNMLEGAQAGIFHAGIVSRLCGLADKTEIKAEIEVRQKPEWLQSKLS